MENLIYVLKPLFIGVGAILSFIFFKYVFLHLEKIQKERLDRKWDKKWEEWRDKEMKTWKKEMIGKGLISKEFN